MTTPNTNTKVTEYVANIESVVCLPDICQKINEMIDKPNTNVELLADVIVLDPGLTATLLKLTNSAFFSFKQPITTVSHAISIIGKNTLRSVVLSSGAVNTLEALTNEFIELSAFWHHSIYTGLLARALSVNFDDLNGEEMFITGMLHDIGKLIIFTKSPDISRTLVEKGITTEKWIKLEQKLLGFTHADVGFKLAKSWKLPDLYCQCIRSHHNTLLKPPFDHAQCVINVANRLAEMIDNDHVEEDLKAVHTKLECAKIGISLTQMKSAISIANEQSFEVMETIYPGSMMIY